MKGQKWDNTKRDNEYPVDQNHNSNLTPQNHSTEKVT